MRKGDAVPDLQKRREKKRASTPAVVFDDRIYFGAACDKRQAGKINGAGHTNTDDEVDVDDEDSDGYTTASFAADDDEDGDEEEDGDDSESLFDTHSFDDSLDMGSLFISHAGTSTTPQKTPKNKTPNKSPRVVPTLNKCKINLQYSDLDRDIIAPDVFLHNGRRAAAVTIWIPNHYSEADVSAFVNDGGHTFTLEFCPPKDFLTTVNQAATNDATVGSSLGEAYATFIQNLPSLSHKKLLVIDLPFKAEERLCPEVLGKSAFAEGIDIIDVDLGNGKNGRQIILAVREVLRDDLKRESVGRRVFQGNAGGGGQPQQQQQYHQAQHQINQQQPQQQYGHHEHNQRRTRVRRHDEIGIVGDHDISGSNA